MTMTERRIIYLTAQRATVYEVRRGALSTGPGFANDEDGFEQFQRHLLAFPSGTLVSVLADVVEEDFHVDLIPSVRGGDRRQLIDRRLAQRFRDTSLSLSISLGIEKTQRRDERVLLSAFTNTQQFQPWLNVLRHCDLAIVGVYSVALLAGALAKKLGYGVTAPCLVVSLQSAGLRQSLVDGGKVRFSRLGPLEPGDAEQPPRVAAAFADETVRIQQYLYAVRTIARDGPPLDALLITPTGRRQLIEATTADSPQIKYQVIDTTDAAQRIGLRDLPIDAGAEALYAYLLAMQPPSQQYAGERIRHKYRMWQGRVALLAGGGALFGICVLFSAWQWFNALDNRSRTTEELQRAKAISEDYSRVTRSFPSIPTTRDNLKLTVDQFEALEKNIRPPEAMLSELATALNTSPQLELESLRWELGANIRPSTKDGKKATPKGDAKQTGAEARYDVVDFTGRIRSIPSSDYRALTRAVDDLVAKIKRQPGIVVISVKLPFDIGSETTLSGDISEKQERDVPSFQVTFGKRVGT
jgi:hypothetical protein